MVCYFVLPKIDAYRMCTTSFFGFLTWIRLFLCSLRNTPSQTNNYAWNWTQECADLFGNFESFVSDFPNRCTANDAPLLSCFSGTAEWYGWININRFFWQFFYLSLLDHRVCNSCMYLHKSVIESRRGNARWTTQVPRRCRKVKLSTSSQVGKNFIRSKVLIQS